MKEVTTTILYSQEKPPNSTQLRIVTTTTTILKKSHQIPHNFPGMYIVISVLALHLKIWGICDDIGLLKGGEDALDGLFRV